MLTVSTIENLSIRPVVTKGRTVIISDEHNNPLVVVMQIADGTTMVANSTDPDFNRVLRSLGINKTVICNNLSIPGPPANAELVAGPVTKIRSSLYG